MNKLTIFLLNHLGMTNTNNSAPILQSWIIINVPTATINNWRSIQWCAVVLIEALKSTNYEGILPNAWVDSWLNIGDKIDKNKMRMGDVIIFGDNVKRTHVSTFIRYSTNGLQVAALGGNQGGALQITWFDMRDVYAVRRIDNL